MNKKQSRVHPLLSEHELVVPIKDINFVEAQEATRLTAGQVDSAGVKVTEAMKIDFCTDSKIMRAGIRQVTSSIMFTTGYVPSEDGLFSERIFGSSPDARKRVYGYIDMRRKFFHPYVYEVIKNLNRSFEKIAAGLVVGHIDEETHYLVEIKDKNHPKYNEEHTGLAWLIEHFHEIKWKETDAIIRKDRIELLNQLTDEDIFVSKWLVVPVFFRDKEVTNGHVKIPDVNYEYNKLIQYTNSLDDDIFVSYNNALLYRVQMILVSLRLLGQNLIKGKHGHFHQAILGKSIDLGSRDVISVPIMDNVQKPNDIPVDMFHTGIPLAKCLVLGYPLIQRYCLQFFEENFKNTDAVMIYKRGSMHEYHAVSPRDIKDQLLIYTQTYIDKKINQFKNTYGERFEPIKVYLKDGTTANFHYTGFDGTMNPNANGISDIIARPMTWTDLFYLAAMETVSDKYVYTTRYPLLSFSGIFPSQCLPLSTTKTMRAWVGGKVYEHYPIIDLQMPKNKVATQFVDTLTMSNLYLSALGGDYDGDTTSSKMVFSLEANEEAREICHSVRHFLSTQGTLIRDVGNEAYLTFYNMTRYD